MQTNKYVVELSYSDWEHDVDPGDVYVALDSALGTHGKYVVERVTDHTETPVDTSWKVRIYAVKEIRQVLKCGLADAMFLTKAAKETGSAKWANVQVESVNDLYRVTIIPPSI